MRRGMWVAMLVATTLLLTGCGASRGSGDIVSEAEARQLFATAVQRTLSADFRGLCALAASKSMCERETASSLRARVPKVAPTIACTYRLPDRKDSLGRTVVVGGQVLVVEGTDGEGRPFETEVLVFHDGQRLVAQNILWWSGMGISQSEPGEPVTTDGQPQAAVRQRCQ